MSFGGVVRALVAGTLAAGLIGACASDGSDPPLAAPGGAAEATEPGDVVEVLVGGRRFATRCAGAEEDPPVMLVSGLGVDMTRSWDSVQARLGGFARVCAYDRLGVGASDRARRPQTFEDMAADLRDVMAELSLKEPVLLVAHSLGGMVAAELVEQSPKAVAGLLLVDAPGPGYPQRVLQRLPRQAGAAGSALRESWEDLLEPRTNPERLDGQESFAAAAGMATLGNVPLLALTHSISELGESVRPRQAADLESAWEESQNRWLALSPRARLERVDLAGHFMQDDQPDVVVDRVRELLAG
jgi:pimeloyl-ACP methyl ester carboxylesterase